MRKKFARQTSPLAGVRPSEANGIRSSVAKVAEERPRSTSRRTAAKRPSQFHPRSVFIVERTPSGDSRVERGAERIHLQLEVHTWIVRRDEDLHDVFFVQRRIVLEVCGDDVIVIADEERVQVIVVAIDHDERPRPRWQTVGGANEREEIDGAGNVPRIFDRKLPPPHHEVRHLR
jgi:hypothetical protein